MISVLIGVCFIWPRSRLAVAPLSTFRTSAASLPIGNAAPIGLVPTMLFGVSSFVATARPLAGVSALVTTFWVMLLII